MTHGKIPNNVKQFVNSEIEKYGFDLAYHYWAYATDFSNLSNWDENVQRAFDKYYRENIKNKNKYNKKTPKNLTPAEQMFIIGLEKENKERNFKK